MKRNTFSQECDYFIRVRFRRAIINTTFCLPVIPAPAITTDAQQKRRCLQSGAKNWMTSALCGLLAKAEVTRKISHTTIKTIRNCLPLP
jgi:hypothetical protein